MLHKKNEKPVVFTKIKFKDVQNKSILVKFLFTRGAAGDGLILF